MGPHALPDVRPQVESNRKAERLDASFRVISRKLPGFQATTVDMSESGLQLLTRGPIDQALVFEMRLEPEMTGYETVEFRGRVMWCREERRGDWRVGIEYLFLDDEAKRRLGELEAFLRKSRSAEIYHRTLMGADQVLNRKPEESQDSAN